MYFYVLLCTLYFLQYPCRLLQTWQAADQPTCTILPAGDLRTLFLVPVRVSAKKLCCDFLPSKGLAYANTKGATESNWQILTYLSPNNKPTSVCLCPGTFQALWLVNAVQEGFIGGWLLTKVQLFRSITWPSCKEFREKGDCILCGILHWNIYIYLTENNHTKDSCR